jgi:hypothetical protein
MRGKEGLDSKGEQRQIASSEAESCCPVTNIHLTIRDKP